MNSPSLPKKEAAVEHTNLLHTLRANPANIIAYTEGSQRTGRTGVGYSITDGLPRQLNEVIPMGDMSEVFNAGLRAIHDYLASCLEVSQLNNLDRSRIHIFTDNQATILRASRTTYGPGQKLALSLKM